MTKYRKFKTIENYKCEDYLELPSPGYQYPAQSNVNKIAIKQPQTRNRNRPILTLKKTWRKKMCSV